jgi:DNA invertase Pin-like site-specific DNA recombinase
MMIGYARVSTDAQVHATQVAALKARRSHSGDR